MSKLRVGSLFSGIGGLDLGFERAGMEIAWMVEKDPFCLKVLTKHWPDVPKYEDVRDVGKHNLERVDVICGGFPCQDISQAGHRVGIEGERSGLWSEFHRIVCDLRPDYVIVENVPGLLVRGIDVVLGDLASCGYDAEWQSIPAAAIGAPQIRNRVFILAYPKGQRRNIFKAWRSGPKDRRPTYQRGGWVKAERSTDRVSFDMAPRYCLDRLWNPQPGVQRVADGLPSELDFNRLRALGNAVVPQVAEFVGRQIVAVEEAS